jgi:hypothetical protein
VENAEGMKEMTNAYKFLVGKPEGNRPLVRHRQRWILRK